MKKKYLNLIFIFLFLYYMMRISFIVSSLFGANSIYLDTEAFSWLDSLFLILLLFYVYNVNIKIRAKIKTKKYVFISVIIVLLTFRFDTKYLEKFYNFLNPVAACNYSNICNIRSTMIFTEDDYAIFLDDSDYVKYYPRLKKGWKIDNTLIEKSYYGNHDKFKIKIYEVGDKYFVYLMMNEIISIDNITDNSGKDFIALKGGFYDFPISDRFGKLIDSIEDYKVFINDEEVEIEK